MPLTRFIALSFALGAIPLAYAADPVAFKVTEPVSIAGVPPVKLGPGSYVLRKVSNSGGARVVQVMSKQQDYVYTTVVAIPAERPYATDNQRIVFSEAPSGVLPALHYWFPPGETLGYEFVAPAGLSAPEPGVTPKRLQSRADGNQHGVANPADSQALSEVLAQIENGKLGAARNRFRRNYFLAQNRDGAFVSFVLALLMIDQKEAWASLDLVRLLNPERMGAMSRLNVDAAVESLAGARSNLKTSRVRRFLLNLAMERTEDPIARTAVLAFERHVVKVDSYPVEIALDRRRQEREKERRREEQWVLAVAKLNDCVKSLLNRVGALEYSASAEGRFGTVTLRVVLTQRRLNDLDAIAENSRRAICDRRARLERLIAQRNAAIARELDSLRSALGELDRQPGFNMTLQFRSLRNWGSAPATGVSRDLMMLAESATLPYLRPSSLLRTDHGYVQINIAASLARLAEWAGY
jgi:hypothetical protein